MMSTSWAPTVTPLHPSNFKEIVEGISMKVEGNSSMELGVRVLFFRQVRIRFWARIHARSSLWFPWHFSLGFEKIQPWLHREVEQLKEIFIFSIRESPPPLNISTPTLAPAPLLGDAIDLGGRFAVGSWKNRPDVNISDSSRQRSWSQHCLM